MRIFLIITQVLLSVLVWCNSQAANKFRAPPPPIVLTKKVQLTQQQPVHSTLGAIVAKNSATLASEVGGIVTEIPFNSGVLVKKGDILLKLNDQIQLADLAQQSAILQQKKWLFERTKKLFKQKSASALDYENAHQGFIAQQATVAAAKARLQQRYVSAPFSGKLGVIQPHVGMYISPGAAVVTLENRNVLWVDFQLPQSLSNRVHVGDTVQIVSKLAPRNQVLKAKITAANPGLTSSRNRVYRGHVINPPSWLTPGSYCKTLVKIGKPFETIILPRSAIQSSTGGDRVWVVHANKTISSRAIDTGDTLASGSVVVKQGLSPSEEVVMLGGFKLYEGQTINPQPYKAK